MVAAIGNARFASDAIDPTRGAESQAMEINGRVAESTQRFVLFLAGSLAARRDCSGALADGSRRRRDRLHRRAAAVLIGYRIDPLYRAFGFAATFYLNLGLLLATAWFALS